MMRNNILLCLLLGVFSSCALWEKEQYDYAYQQINENEILVDFTKINSGTWDTLLFVSPYATSEQIGLGYIDSEFLARRSVNDGVIICGYISNEQINGYSSCPRVPVDFDQLFDDSIFVKKYRDQRQ